MTRHGTIMSGLAILGVGLLITIVTFAAASAAGGGTYLLAFGPVIAGVVRIARGLAMPEDRVRTYDIDEDGTRRIVEDDDHVQVAGRTCVVCTKKIAMASVGTACAVCSAFLHHACEAAHARTHVETAPYRA